MLAGREAPTYLQRSNIQQESSRAATFLRGRFSQVRNFPFSLPWKERDKDRDLQKPLSVRINMVRAIFTGAFIFQLYFFKLFLKAKFSLSPI